MPITNLNNDHFSEDEKTQMRKAWQVILDGLTRKTRNLSPEERQRYGSISEQNKLVVLKVLEYHDGQEHMDCPDIDYKELKDDFADRDFLAKMISSLMEGVRLADNIRITHDYDCYTASSTDYEFTKYKMGTDSGASWEAKYNDLLPFFKTYYAPTRKADESAQ